MRQEFDPLSYAQCTVLCVPGTRSTGNEYLAENVRAVQYNTVHYTTVLYGTVLYK